ncbi:MAG: hypothetical protein LBK61_00505 [Spirochaetaceae bacterium]|jgi:hypothetical protein|nr:hypothetical protein [Spirochaetaceae bacterium]
MYNVKKYCGISLCFIIIFSQNIFADDNNTATEDGIVDYGVAVSRNGQKWEDEITPKEWAGEIVTKVFTNKLSGHTLYYEGADGWGGGNYYVLNDGKKQIIGGKYNQWSPVVRWYGADIVEIWIGANVSWHTYQYYDYTSETYTDLLDRAVLFGKPLYVDRENHYVVWTGFGRVTVTDIRIQQDIIEYTLDEGDDPHAARIENGKLIVLLKDRQMVFDYP